MNILIFNSNILIFKKGLVQIRICQLQETQSEGRVQHGPPV